MARVLRWAGYVLGGLAVIAIGAALFVWAASDMKLTEISARPERLETPTPAQLADGPRQLRVLGCLSCHGDMLQGDLFMDEPGVANAFEELAFFSHDVERLGVYPAHAFRFRAG